MGTTWGKPKINRILTPTKQRKNKAKCSKRQPKNMSHPGKLLHLYVSFYIDFYFFSPLLSRAVWLNMQELKTCYFYDIVLTDLQLVVTVAVKVRTDMHTHRPRSGANKSLFCPHPSQEELPLQVVQKIQNEEGGLVKGWRTANARVLARYRLMNDS